MRRRRSEGGEAATYGAVDLGSLPASPVDLGAQDLGAGEGDGVISYIYIGDL
jgi:hypothetical protein